jgi:UDPglucose 6-dehydrogenase
LLNKISKKKITFLGVTFKPNTDDMRESSSLMMIPYLVKKGAQITYYDPTGEKEELSKFKKVFFARNINEACKDSDLIIIHTEWEEFKALDFKSITMRNNFKVFDMRNLYSPNEMSKLGIRYFSIGRQ